MASTLCRRLPYTGAAFVTSLLLVSGLASCAAESSVPEVEMDKERVAVKYLMHEVIIRPSAENELELAAALAAIGGRVVDDDSPLTTELGYVRILLPDDINTDQAIEYLERESLVEKAEPNFVVEHTATPNDSYYSSLWGMTRIAAPAAWNVTSGSSQVIVAVSDTGVDYAHPDLAANMFVNEGEVPGNGRDDDGNGFVDDVRGWDFANNDADPRDDHGHGTHVSGTIGAVGNNGIGVVGVSWKVKVLPVKFLGASGSGSLWAGAQSLLYAAKMNAKVVNASWGCACASSYLDDAAQKLAEAGGMLVAAAGNSATDNDRYTFYPAGIPKPNVVAVAAVTPTSDSLAYFSNYGATTVHVAAPGQSILSTLPGGNYASWSGTSMAAPHVSGVVALYYALHPDATFDVVKEKLIATSDPSAALEGKVVANGRINAQNMVIADGDPPAPPAGVSVAVGERSDLTVSWEANSEEDLAGYQLRWGTASGSYQLELQLPPEETTAYLRDLENGVTYYFVVHAFDRSGNASAPSTEVSAAPHDLMAPPQVVDLVASPIPGSIATGSVAAASGELSSYYEAENAYDGSPDTAWITPGRFVPEEEHLIVELSTSFFVDRIALLPSAVYPEFFPIDFDLDVSADGSSWVAVGGMRGVEAVFEQQLLSVAFAPIWAGWVRLRVLTSYRHPSGFHFAGLAELAVREVSSAPDTVELRFTAPGDDPGVGWAAEYDVRRATEPFDEVGFDGAVRVQAPAPAFAGIKETVLVQELLPETTYHFALRAIDEAGNVSPMSNLASATTLVVPPGTITDLTVAGSDSNSVALSWTAPGADGFAGQAAAYELRYAETPLDAASFAGATSADGVPLPATAGAREYHTVSRLQRGHLYYFAIRAVDAGGVTGGVSNVVTAIPRSGIDSIPPAAVVDLRAVSSQAQVRASSQFDSASSEQLPGSQLVDGDVSTSWSSSAGAPTNPEWVVVDLGSPQPVCRFRMFPSAVGWYVADFPEDFEIQGSVDRVNWTTLVSVEGARAEHGVWEEWSARAAYARYVRVSVSRRGPSSGGLDPDATFVEVAELEVYALASGYAADLSWVSPGDDDWLGTAASYDVRRSRQPIVDATAFAAATPVAARTPRPAGTIEVLETGALEPESAHYFALRATDEAGNHGALSNVARIDTPDIPPAAITDLRVTGATTTSLSLAFTASGDDGTTGTATAYELRYSMQPLSPQTWDLAPRWEGIGDPQPPGSTETVTVTDLFPSARYYFGIKVSDDRSGSSLLSNVARGETLDGVPPETIGDLAVAPVDPRQDPPLSSTVSGDSGSYSPETRAGNVIDGDERTMWLGPNRGATGTDYITFDLAGERSLGRLRLRGADGNLDLFPTDFRLDVQAQEGGPWTTVIIETGFSTSGGWEEWALGAVKAVQARLIVTATNPWGSRHNACLAELELYEDPTDYTSLRLRFTAPGDDGRIGTASRYDLRMAGTPLSDDTFELGVALPNPLRPSPAGYLERHQASGLQAETTYCFALKAFDEMENASLVSNSVCATTPGVPPATVTDLVVAEIFSSSATLTWTAPGGDGTVGQAARYELRWSESRINRDNWDTATEAPAPVPGPVGSVERAEVAGLDGLTTYYFALRAIDGAGNTSAISNNASGKTLDDSPPAAIDDLLARTKAGVPGSLVLSWTAPGDNGTLGRAASYDLRVAATPIDESTFAAATRITIPAPGSAGADETAVVGGLAPETLFYAAIKTMDAARNVSAISNIASARSGDQPPAAVTNLAVVGGSGSSATDATLAIRWTASGDDGTSGRATSYDVRHATSTITDSTFAAATKVSDPPLPGEPGTVENYTIRGLRPGVRYYVALRVVDDRNNASALSNVVSSATPDEVVPARVADLAAQQGSAAGYVTLSWTAPGDDGVDGTVSSYDLRYSREPITADNFSSAKAVALAPVPVAGGRPQSAIVNGLLDESQFFFALKAKDDAGNWSALSNQASARTRDVPPAAITNLTAGSATASSFSVSWTAPGDDGSVGQASAYDIRYALVPITNDSFATATKAAAPAPEPAGKSQSQKIDNLSSGTTYYVAIKTQDDRGNWSALSNLAAGVTSDVTAPGRIAALVAETGSMAGSVKLSWVATGDDGSTGTARSYQLRRAAEPISEESFASATPIPGTLAPRAAGSAESFTVIGLAGEQTFHFAIRAVDEAGNVGGVSPSAAAATPPVAPAVVGDLSATGGAGAVTIAWTAPGDDGNEGTATSYDVRYDTKQITASSFASANRVLDAPAPAQAKTRQTHTVRGLVESTTYWFALKTTDDTGTVSGMSNVASAKTLDVTPPAAPASLVATVASAGRTLRSPVAVIASSELGATWDAWSAIDGDATTSWASAPSVGGVETLTVDFGDATVIDGVRMLADDLYHRLFPIDFSIEASLDGKAWETVVVEEEFAATADDWSNWGFSALPGRYLRITALETAASYGRHYAIISEVAAYTAGATEGRVRLTWVAPGDDGLAGTVKEYQVFRHHQPITEDSLAGAVPVAGAPTPRPAGSLQSITVGALAGETRYHFAVRAADEAGNRGALATATVVTNPVPPAAVRDLAATAESTTRASLSWTAPGDDGQSGAATRYEARYAPWPITSLNFPLATAAPGVPSPANAGTKQSMAIDNLEPGTAYRFALVAYDEIGTASYLSNVALAVTLPAPDRTPPAAVTTLAARLPVVGGDPLPASVAEWSSEQAPDFSAAALVDGDLSTQWASAARSEVGEEWVRVDLGEAVVTDRVVVWASEGLSSLFPPGFKVEVSPDGLAWTTVAEHSGYRASPGEAIEAKFEAMPVRFVELEVTELARHANDLYYAVVGELEVLTAAETPDSVVVSWTAPGDDGMEGEAASYDLRIGACAAGHESRTSLATGAPLPAGSPERYFVTGLPPGAYCLSMIATDESGNASELSNVVEIRTSAAPAPDTAPPTAPTGLEAQGTSPSQIEVSWQPATDNVGVAGYRVLRDGVEVGTTTVTGFGDSGLAAAQSYVYAVKTFDWAGNESRISAEVTGTTREAPSQGYLVPARTVGAGSGQGSEVAQVVIEELDGVTTSGYPLMLSHVFKRGDVHDSVTVRVGGRYLPTQTDVKVRWDDGSVRHALISCLLPEVPAGGRVALALVDGGAANRQDPVRADELLATDFEAVLAFTVEGTRLEVSARELLERAAATPQRWINGAVATELVLNNLGLNPHPQLNTILNIRVFPGWNGARVFSTVENVWGDRRGNLAYDVEVTGGYSAPVSLFRQPGLTHNYNSRWGKELWVGEKPSRINVRYDLEYLIATRMIPNYDTTLAPAESVLAAEYGRWLAAERGPMGKGFLEPYFPTTGGRQEIGLLPEWTARYLLTMDWRMFEITVGHGLLSGSIPAHLREFDASRSSFGRVISIDDRPTSWFSWNDYYTYIAERDRLPAPIGSTSTQWEVDRAHQGSFAYVPYLVTGERFFLDEMFFWSGWNLGDSNHEYRQRERGLFHGQVRAQAWAIRNLVHAAVMAPDGEPEKEYFLDKVANNIEAWDEKYVENDFHPLHPWDWISNRSDGGRPDSTLVPTIRHISSPWQDDFMLIVLGHMGDLGFATEDLAAYLGVSLIARGSHPDLNHYRIGAYHLPMTYTETPDVLDPYYPITNWADVEAACLDEPTDFLFQGADGYQFSARGALSFVSSMSGWQAAWDFVNGASHLEVLDDSPKWAFVPRQ
ncbi:MAG: discoidin domain-containing protein [Pseudomonadota bacterium]